MYFFYKQGNAPVSVTVPEGINISKCKPRPLVANMHSMQIGRRKVIYYEIMTFLFRGFARTFIEYDVIKNNVVVSKAVLISKVPEYKFLPRKGVHLCYCETILEERGHGYYPLLLNYIQNDLSSVELYMIVDCQNIASNRGVEKAGFVKYGIGVKNQKKAFVVEKLFN